MNEETFTKEEVDYQILQAIYKNHIHIYGEECKVKGCDIFSVQRLSDMKVFAIGDEVEGDKIKELRIKDSMLFIQIGDYTTISLDLLKKWVKKDYEILSFLDNYGTVIKWQGETEHGGYNYKQWYEASLAFGYKIHSVKRHDNEVFSLADETNYGVIEKFYLGWDGMEVHFIRGDGAILNSIEHKKKDKVLYTTKDGWPVLEKDTYPIYKVDEKFQILQFYACDAGNYYGSEYFISEDKAKEFVIYNKPCLSIKDIYSAISLGTTNEEKLKKLVKQKINGLQHN